MQFPFIAPVNGFNSYKDAIVRSKVEVGDRILVVPEPSNEHDPFALRITCRSTTFGYLPKRLAGLLAADFPGEAFEGEVSAVYRDKDQLPTGIRVAVLRVSSPDFKPLVAFSSGGTQLGSVSSISDAGVKILLAGGVEVTLPKEVLVLKELASLSEQ